MLKSQEKTKFPFELRFSYLYSCKKSLLQQSVQFLLSRSSWSSNVFALKVLGLRDEKGKIKIFIVLQPLSFVKVHKIYDAKNNNDKEEELTEVHVTSDFHP